MMIYHLIIMTHVSRRKVDTEVEHLFEELLKSSFANLSGNESARIISTLFAETEVKMVEKRIAIILLTEMNYKNEDIAYIVKTTRQTVVRTKILWKLVPETDKQLLLKRLKGAVVKEELHALLEALKHIDISRSTFRKKLLMM